EPMTMVAGRVQSLAAQSMFGAAIAVAAMTVSWAIRGRDSLLIAGWMVLALAFVGQRVIVPIMSAPTAPVEGADTAIREATEMAWGMHVVVGGASADSLPLITGRWDPAGFAQLADGRGATLLAATAGMRVL